MHKLLLSLIKNNIQFIKFCFVGAMNASITIISFNVLLKLGINYIVSNILGYILGMLNGYIWSRMWVFKSKGSILHTSTKFIIVNIMALGISSLLLFTFVTQFHIKKIIAQIFVTLIVAVFNYIFNKFWTFKH